MNITDMTIFPVLVGALQHPTEVPHREILWNVSSPLDRFLLYFLLAIAVIICVNGLFHRFLLWTSGAPDRTRFQHFFQRVKEVWWEILFQRGTNREWTPRVFHSLIFYGFLVLLFTTTMVFIDYDLGIKIYQGNFYLGVTLLSDLFGLGLLCGVILAARRRYVERPEFVHSGPMDGFLLGTLALLVVQGFLLEGLRIHVTQDPWAAYSPVGWVVAQFLWAISPHAAKVLHYGTWWFHTITVYAFIALIPYTKFFHILASSANRYFRPDRRPLGALPFPGSVEQMMEEAMSRDDGEFRIGVTKVQDLTWKKLLELDACTACGRCQSVCPAYRSGTVLSPKWLILDTRNHLLHLHADGKLEVSEPKGTSAVRAFGNWSKKLDAFLLRTFLLRETPAKELPPGMKHAPPEIRGINENAQHGALAVGLNPDAKLAGEVVEEDVFWSCTTCRACVEVCPVGIEHVDYIVEARRAMALMEGNIPSEAQASLKAIENRGNPFGPAEERMSWFDGAPLRIVEPGAQVDVLYWVGCISAFDRRKQQIARALIRILDAAGLSWGILGNREACTGDPARRLGEENLFQTQARKNIDTLLSVNFTTIVANCPHCFHTIRNEYPALETKFLESSDGKARRVIHHTQLIDELIKEGKLAFTKPLEKELTFHDPCYLGRYNDTYDAPREILVQLGASKVHEMKSTREKSLCCGAGGGHFWMDLKNGKERINVLRVNEAADTDASVIATGCPFCMHMLDDGLKLTNKEEQLAVRDIAELVAEAL